VKPTTIVTGPVGKACAQAPAELEMAMANSHPLFKTSPFLPSLNPKLNMVVSCSVIEVVSSLGHFIPLLKIHL
jgi:hypothetical protein